jgi:hypothetical protein
MSTMESMLRLRMCEGGGVTTFLQRMTVERSSGWHMCDNGTRGKRG